MCPKKDLFIPLLDTHQPWTNDKAEESEEGTEYQNVNH